MKHSILLLYIIVGGILFGCEQDVEGSSTMEAYYIESTHLSTASLDSVQKFKNKLNGYLEACPQAKQSPRYQQIQENIKAASARINITIDATWDGEENISF